MEAFRQNHNKPTYLPGQPKLDLEDYNKSLENARRCLTKDPSSFTSDDERALYADAQIQKGLLEELISANIRLKTYLHSIDPQLLPLPVTANGNCLIYAINYTNHAHTGHYVADHPQLRRMAAYLARLYLFSDMAKIELDQDIRQMEIKLSEPPTINV